MFDRLKGTPVLVSFNNRAGLRWIAAGASNRIRKIVDVFDLSVRLLYTGAVKDGAQAPINF